MRTLAARHFIARLLLRILHDHATLRLLHIYNKSDHRDGSDCEQHDNDPGHCSRTAQFQGIGDRSRETRDDAREDQQRNTLTNTALVNLFAQPDKKHGSANQRDDGRKLEKRSGVDHDCRASTSGGRFQAGRDTESLNDTNTDRQVPGILVDLDTSGDAVFLNLFERRIHRRHQLHDDRC